DHRRSHPDHAQEHRARRDDRAAVEGHRRIPVDGRADDRRRRGDGRARHDARQDCRLLRGRSGRRGRRPPDADGAVDDRASRRHRRRHRHRDVHADLQSDQQADWVVVDLRARLSTLIAVRVVVSTLLLGSAILVQISRPGSFPIDPFFFLIGLTYALSVVYLASLRYVERFPWIADAQLGIDAILVSAFIHVTGGITSYFSSLYLLPIMAASTVRFRRGALQVAALSAILYLALVSAQYFEPNAFFPASWQALGPSELPTTRFAQYTV